MDVSAEVSLTFFREDGESPYTFGMEEGNRRCWEIGVVMGGGKNVLVANMGAAGGVEELCVKLCCAKTIHCLDRAPQRNLRR